MCGIVGVLQKRSNSIPTAFNSLSKLKNRGYDSVGYGYVGIQDFNVIKKASTSDQDAFELIQSSKEFSSSSASCCIGHTRWATHGSKTDYNSHPHTSFDRTCMIVHNGILENYKHIKNFLEKSSYTFYSDTDSEVIANLVSYNYKEYKSCEIAIHESLKQMIGTWGLLIMFSDSPNTIYCCRHGSPLLIGFTESTFMASSEQAGFTDTIQDYISLKNGDLCKAYIDHENDNLIVKYEYDYVPRRIMTRITEISPLPYAHWTLKEIHDQTKTCSAATNYGARVKNNIVKLGGLCTNLEKLRHIKNVIILGCGTSYNAGQCARHFFTNNCAFNTVQVFDASEFKTCDVPNIGDTLVILVSQSGETRDLYNCFEKCKKCTTLGIINVVDSLISREVDCGCYTNCGRENGVASTKSFTSQLIVLSLVAFWFGHHQRIHLNQPALEDCKSLPQHAGYILEHCKWLNLNMFDDKNSVFVLGKGIMEYVAKEGSLKMKEMAYIHAEGYAGSSLKHGPFAMLDEKVIVVLLINQQNLESMLNVYEQVKSRECSVYVISDCDIECDCKIPYSRNYSQVLFSIALQYISYNLAIKKNINPDYPRNLAKVVTVH